MEDINQIIESACSTYEKDQYAMYLRKSRADLELEALGEGETLAKHKKMLFKLAAKHDIHPDQITIYHEVVSGESLQDRPEAQRLLADVHARKYKGVLVAEIERLARGNTKDQGEVAEAFQISGTKIITPAKVYDQDKESDQEYFEFGLFMSRREYKTIRRRLEAGKQQSIEDGNYLCAYRLFGYDIVRISKKERILVPNEKEAPIAKMMFDWYTEEGKSYGWIAKKMTAMGIPTVRGAAEWNRETIREMLSNVHYIGMVQWNARKTVKVFDEVKGKLVKKRIANDKEIYKGKHEGIISKEQFEKAQAITKKHAAPVRDTLKISNPLATIIKCKDCGKHLYLQPYAGGNRQTRYMHGRSQLCKKKSSTVADVLDALVESLKAYIADYEIKMQNSSDQSEIIRHQELITAMEAELSKREVKRKRLFDAYEDGSYTRDEFIERKNHHNIAIDELKKQIEEAKASAPEPIDYSAKIVTLHSLIDCIRDPEIDAKAKNDFLKQFIDRIDYDVIDYGQCKGGKVVLDVFLKQG